MIRYVPSPIFAELFEFLGVDPGFEIENLAPRTAKKYIDQVDERAYSYLRDVFKHPNEDLYSLLGCRYDWS